MTGRLSIYSDDRKILLKIGMDNVVWKSQTVKKSCAHRNKMATKEVFVCKNKLLHLQFMFFFSSDDQFPPLFDEYTLILFPSKTLKKIYSIYRMSL